MGKRVSDDTEMTAIRDHLDRQDKTMHEILTVLRGSVSLGVEGILKRLQDSEGSIDQLCKDVAHLQRWQKNERENKGKLTVHWTDVAKTIFAIIGGIGTFVGIVLALKQAIEK